MMDAVKFAVQELRVLAKQRSPNLQQLTTYLPVIVLRV